MTRSPAAVVLSKRSSMREQSEMQGDGGRSAGGGRGVDTRLKERKEAEYIVGRSYARRYSTASDAYIQKRELGRTRPGRQRRKASLSWRCVTRKEREKPRRHAAGRCGEQSLSFSPQPEFGSKHTCTRLFSDGVVARETSNCCTRRENKYGPKTLLRREENKGRMAREGWQGRARSWRSLL
eukprot:1143766-Pleurochrysis_carterae.AAC.2